MENTYSTNLDLKKTDIGVLIFRICIAALMLTHGVPKLLTFFSGEEIGFADPFGLGPATTLALVVFAEFICSVLILIGLGTKLAAIPLIINMAVISFIIHMPDGLERQELPLLYLGGYILLFFTGSGKYSLDHFFLSKDRS